MKKIILALAMFMAVGTFTYSEAYVEARDLDWKNFPPYTQITKKANGDYEIHIPTRKELRDKQVSDDFTCYVEFHRAFDDCDKKYSKGTENNVRSNKREYIDNLIKERYECVSKALRKYGNCSKEAYRDF
jgi:hypothetical protein